MSVLPSSKSVMKTLASQFMALRTHRANGRDAAELTASNHHRGSRSPRGLSRTGWFRQARSAALPAARPAPAARQAAAGHQRRKASGGQETT